MADIVKVGPRGQVVLPRKLLADLGIKEGDNLLVDGEGETIVLRRKARRFGEYLEKFGRPRSLT